MQARTLAAALVAATVTASASGRAGSIAAGCPPWCPAPPLTIEPSPHAPGRWYPGLAFRSFSLQGGVEQTRVGAAHDDGGSLGLQSGAFGLIHKGALTARYWDRTALSYGTDGLRFGITGDGAMGFEAPLGPGHGPFVRLGVRAEYVHSQHFHTSLVEFPQAQVGYSIAHREFHFELGARGGWVWVGRYGVDGATTERLGQSPELGAILDLDYRPLVLRAEVSRVRVPGAPSPIDRFDLFLCGALGAPTICARSELLGGDLRRDGIATATSAAYVGISLGLGTTHWRW